MSEVEAGNTDEQLSIDRIVERFRHDIDAAARREKAEQRQAAKDAEASIREDAAQVLANTLAEIRRRVAAGSVPVEVRYGAIPPELKLALRDAQKALNDEAAAVVYIPYPDRYGHRERAAYAVIDVSRLYRD